MKGSQAANSFIITVLLLTSDCVLSSVLRGFRTSTTRAPESTTTSVPRLPDLPNAIHYPIYIPSQSIYGSGTFPYDLMASSSWPVSAVYSPLGSEWAVPPFGIEVYDEQTLLRNREKLRQRQQDLLRARQDLRRNASEARRRTSNSFQDWNDKQSHHRSLNPEDINRHNNYHHSRHHHTAENDRSYQPHHRHYSDSDKHQSHSNHHHKDHNPFDNHVASGASGERGDRD